MRLPLFQVDAFSRHVFGGNPAAVVLLEEALPAALMQAIAAENNLSETAFVRLQAAGVAAIRWFTPTTEVALCGHATLAAAHVLLTQHPSWSAIRFHCSRGLLLVQRSRHGLQMQFPEDLPQPWQAPHWLEKAIGAAVIRSAHGRDDALVEIADATQLARLKPDLKALTRLPFRGLIITASGGPAVDFSSRFFAPQSGIPEDPVTGSAHTLLTPFWAQQRQCRQLQARQLSPRGGELHCHWQPPYVNITGQAVTYLTGHLLLPDAVTGNSQGK